MNKYTYTGGPLTLLGSTGSIGTQTLDVARYLHIPIDALTAGSNDKLAEAQAREFRPRLFVMRDHAAAARLRQAIADLPTKVEAGAGQIEQAAGSGPGGMVLNAISGFAGLLPTLAAIEAGRHVALANKETMVCCGRLVMDAAKSRGVRILPVDSEHCAIFQCLGGTLDSADARRIILTASGGPFRGWTRERLGTVTLEQALAHPTWSMGQKITIDSATLFNKALEYIEAAHLFGASPGQIEILIHPESIVHSMVEFRDKSVIAQLSRPNMRLCIQYALTYPQRADGGLCEPLDLAACGSLSFSKPDRGTFPALELAHRALVADGTLPCVLNAANERAVEAFIDGKIRFTQIDELVAGCMDAHRTTALQSIAQVMDADRWAREYTEKLIKS